MILTYDFEQGAPEWLAARCGLLTASEIKLIVTPSKLQAANNDKSRAHLYEMLAQRVTGYVEPHYISDDMLRGHADEIDARDIYDSEYAPVHQVGFVTNEQWGFTLGCSPDGLVGDDGMIEVKSRRQKYQIETILSDEVPSEYMLQIQTCLLVTGRKWCDFITYSAGLPMFTKRVFADDAMQSGIVSVAAAFEDNLAELQAKYDAMLADSANRLIPTERKIIEEITV